VLLIPRQAARWQATLAAVVAVVVIAGAIAPSQSMAQSVNGGSIRGTNQARSPGSGSGGDLESIAANTGSKAKTILGILGALLSGAIILWAFFIERSPKLVGLALLGCVIGGLAISGGLWDAGEKTGNDLLDSGSSAPGARR